MYRVIIADDEEAVRNRLKSILLKRSDSFEVVGCFENGFDALENGISLSPDILITDIRMPYIDGIDLIKHFTREFPLLQSIIVSGYDSFDYAKEAISLGVVGYLTKPVGESILARYLEKVRAIRSRSASSRWEIPIWERRRAIFAPQRLFFPSDALLINIKTSCSWKQRNQYLLCSDKMPDNLTFTKCQIARK